MTSRLRFVYPEGREPLLANWQAGRYETHPSWTDPDFWAFVADLHRQLDEMAARATIKRRARKGAS